MTVNKLFIPLNNNPRAELRLFCFPYAGGSPRLFSDWANNLDSRIEIYSLNLPGRGTRFSESNYLSMPQLINDALSESSTLLEKPIIFLGYSLGAKIAYELMCSLLKTQVLHLKHFIVLASPAPHLKRRAPPIHQLNDINFIQALRKYSGTPNEILANQDLMSALLPSLRSDFSILENLQPAEIKNWPVPLSILGGEFDQQVRHADLDSWGELFTKVHINRRFKGDHFFINTHSRQLLATLNDIVQCEI